MKGRKFMIRTYRLILTLTCAMAGLALVSSAAHAAPTISNPEVMCVTVGGVESGTDNSTFIFRCRIQTPAAETFLPPPQVVIDGVQAFNMVRDPTNDLPTTPPTFGWKAAIVGGNMN